MPVKAREARERLQAAGYKSTDPIAILIVQICEEQYQMMKRLFELAQQLDKVMDNMAKFVHVGATLQDNYQKMLKRVDENGLEVRGLDVKTTNDT